MQFQKWPKINFWTGKKFKTTKNAISWRKKRIYLIWRVFLPGLYLNFLARCVINKYELLFRTNFVKNSILRQKFETLDAVASCCCFSSPSSFWIEVGGRQDDDQRYGVHLLKKDQQNSTVEIQEVVNMTIGWSFSLYVIVQ